jgi:hypothetical protein
VEMALVLDQKCYQARQEYIRAGWPPTDAEEQATREWLLLDPEEAEDTHPNPPCADSQMACANASRSCTLAKREQSCLPPQLLRIERARSASKYSAGIVAAFAVMIWYVICEDRDGGVHSRMARTGRL